MKKVLFVCSGNTCRSPLAEAIFHKLKPDESYEAQSAGMMAMDGKPMSEGSKAALAKQGLAEQHLSQGLTGHHLEWADVILTMTENHKRSIFEIFPDKELNLYTLKEFILDDPETENLIQKLYHHIAQLELKRAAFITKHQGKVDKYNNEGQDISGQDELEEELLAQLKPEQEAIELVSSKLPSFDISDPYGAGNEVYEDTYRELEEAVQKLIIKLKETNDE